MDGADAPSGLSALALLCRYAGANPDGIRLVLGQGRTVFFCGKGYEFRVRYGAPGRVGSSPSEGPSSGSPPDSSSGGRETASSRGGRATGGVWFGNSPGNSSSLPSGSWDEVSPGHHSSGHGGSGSSFGVDPRELLTPYLAGDWGAGPGPGGIAGEELPASGAERYAGPPPPPWWPADAPWLPPPHPPSWGVYVLRGRSE